MRCLHSEELEELRRKQREADMAEQGVVQLYVCCAPLCKDFTSACCHDLHLFKYG